MLSWAEQREIFYRLLSRDYVDFLGITGKLLLDRSARGETLEWLRCMGFVHLFTASGIHLYLLSDLTDTGVRTLSRFVGLPPLLGKRLSFIFQGSAWMWIWALSDFRWGLLRPLILVGLRVWGRGEGRLWRRWLPLGIALILDLVLDLCVWVYSGTNIDLSGRIHYGLAVGGGLLGYEWAREKGWGSLGQHCALAWCSWIFTGVLQLHHSSSVSPWTPVLSLLTIPLITRLIYPALISITVLIACFPSSELLHEALLWLSTGMNHTFFQLAIWVDQHGGWLEVSEKEALAAWILGGGATWYFLGKTGRLCGPQSRRRPPSAMKISPVTQDA